MHYDSDKQRQIKKRYDATYGIETMSGYYRDEYPYASKFEGGKGALVALVPWFENNKQGQDLKKLYKNMNSGDAFLVLPIPIDREPEPVPQPSPVPVFPIVPALKGAPRVPTGILAPVFNRIMQFYGTDLVTTNLQY